jgi:prepilin signal peptidase PulO-like enzyme (type II secretory pathway)
MVRTVPVSKLTEGDWLYKNIRVKGKLIRSSWEGLSKKEINFIKKNRKKVRVKYGIAFVPVFFIAFIVFLYLWNTGLWNSFW